VPKAWAPGGALDVRAVYLHGGQWMFYSPFDYADLVMDLAARFQGPVLAIDYPLTPAGSWSDQKDAALQGLRWLAAWDGAAAGAVCAPGSCTASAAAAGRGPVAEKAPTLQLLMAAAARPNITIGGAWWLWAGAGWLRAPPLRVCAGGELRSTASNVFGSAAPKTHLPSIPCDEASSSCPCILCPPSTLPQATLPEATLPLQPSPQ
jgi:hypothetical protein